jgi:hypothetical protein
VTEEHPLAQDGRPEHLAHTPGFSPFEVPLVGLRRIDLEPDLSKLNVVREDQL